MEGSIHIGTPPDPVGQLQTEAARFKAFFHASTDGIFLSDGSGRIVEVNDRAVEMLGYPREQLMTLTLPQLMDPSTWDEAGRAFMRAQVSGHARFETSFVRSDGSMIPTEVTWSRLMLDGEMLLHGSVSDITERNRAMEESRLAREEAERANEARLLFLATMSHEIRTPLNGIMGFTDLLLDSDLTGEQRDYLGMVRRSSDILLNIIDDILNFSRIESGRLELEETDFDPAECIEEVFDMHVNNAVLERVELLYDVGPEMPPKVRGDVARVRQILMNLVSNALKFTEAGSVVVRCTVQPGPKNPESRDVVFSVRDTGIGFNPEITENLFEPFYQEDASTTRKFEGTGLGLSICRKLVERMGGWIGAYSRPGEGAEFRFGIPLVVGGLGPFQLAETSQRFAGKRALVVDANEFGAEVMKRRLARWGMETLAVPGSDEALRMLKDSEFDVVLYDLGANGLEAPKFTKKAKRCRASRNAGLVLLGPARMTQEKEKGLDWGFHGVLTKPVRRHDMKGVLGALLFEGGVVPEAPPPPQKGESRRNGRARKRKNRPLLLIAEDNQINARLVSLVMERLGFEAHVAENGREVLAKLNSGQQYAAILMDMRMPEMDGIEASRRIRLGQAGTIASAIPIYALTANVLKTDREACLEAGMNGYFAKPLQAEEVEAAFREAGIITDE